MTEQLEPKFYCERCKTGYPANVLFQIERKYWRICQKCSKEWHKDDPITDLPPTKLPVIEI